MDRNEVVRLSILYPFPDLSLGTYHICVLGCCEIKDVKS